MTDQQSNTGPSPALPSVEDEGAVLEWSCHKAKQKPLLAVLVSGLNLAFGVIVFYATERSAVFAGLALVILFLSLSRFYLPIRYRLSDRKIMIKTLTQTLYKDWSVYRSCWPDKNGILLSPFADSSRLENFRGVYLLFNHNAQEVTAFVKARLNSNATPVPPKLKEPS